jgi:hypothetical protein
VLDPAPYAPALAWALFVLTPVAVVLFLTTFVVNLYGEDDYGRFKRFCARAQLQAFGLVLVCLVLTARYF